MVNRKWGDMLAHEHECYVNTINCVGAMGAGIALEFKKKYPTMYDRYRRACEMQIIAPGDAWVYRTNNLYVIGLAVKYHYRNRIRVSWAKMAVRNFVNKLSKTQVKDVALPRIGSANGGRGAPFQGEDDNWPAISEDGYREFEPFLLKELDRLPNVNFTIYSR